MVFLIMLILQSLSLDSQCRFQILDLSASELRCILLFLDFELFEEVEVWLCDNPNNVVGNDVYGMSGWSQEGFNP